MTSGNADRVVELLILVEVCDDRTVELAFEYEGDILETAEIEALVEEYFDG